MQGKPEHFMATLKQRVALIDGISTTQGSAELKVDTFLEAAISMCHKCVILVIYRLTPKIKIKYPINMPIVVPNSQLGGRYAPLMIRRRVRRK